MPDHVIADQRVPRIALAALPPLSLYVHVPWCARKCPYCDFNSHEIRPTETAPGRTALDAALERGYSDALIADLETALPAVWGRRVSSIFFGGGTPSLLSAATLDGILSEIRARLPIEPNAEITLEANPGTFEAAKFEGFLAAGINRLSIGVQSFDDRHLQALGRIHDGGEARNAIHAALRLFDNVNVDLMYALPGQRLDEALADVRQAAGYGVQHISAYHLAIEPNTWFHRHPPKLPDEDMAADMQEGIESLLAERGYRHYETSAFARAGRASRHNLNYWTFGDYLGIGAGAHGKLSVPGRIVRESRYRHPREYVEKVRAGDAVQSSRAVDPAELPFEFMMNALRLTEGFELRLFAERAGLPLGTLAPTLRTAEDAGYIERDAMRVRPTLRGRRFLNDLLQLFLTGRER